MAAIMRDQLGPVVEKILLVAVTFSFFAAGMVTMAIGARLVYAMARDDAFLSPVMRRVNPRTHDADPGDDPDLRRWGRPDGRAAG